MSLLVLCPSRGRPDKATELLQTFESTASGETELIFVIDMDETGDYPGNVLRVGPHDRRGMTDPLNDAVARYWNDWDIIGFVGDDHRFRTDGWAREVKNALTLPGFAYGDDLFQRERLATHIFISSEILRALGWMALPDCAHLYLDNAWMALGSAIESLHYLPDVIIEHLHPLAGKAVWDEGYNRVNAQSLYDSDGVAFHRWIENEFPAAVERIRTAREH